MAHLLRFGFEIFDVLLMGSCLDRNPFDHLYSISFQAFNLSGIVGHEANLVETQVNQNLCPNSIVPHIGFETQCLIGLHSVLS